MRSANGAGAFLCDDAEAGPESSPSLSIATAHELHYGTARIPLARIVPDDTYPTMWRIHWPDDRVSDMVNLARAKDAATAICERGPPARNRNSFHWKLKRSNSPTGGRTARHSAWAAHG